MFETAIGFRLISLCCFGYIFVVLLFIVTNEKIAGGILQPAIYLYIVFVSFLLDLLSIPLILNLLSVRSGLYMFFLEFVLDVVICFF